MEPRPHKAMPKHTANTTNRVRFKPNVILSANSGGAAAPVGAGGPGGGVDTSHDGTTTDANIRSSASAMDTHRGRLKAAPQTIGDTSLTCRPPAFRTHELRRCRPL